MKKINVIVLLFGLIFTACGGSSTSSAPYKPVKVLTVDGNISSLGTYIDKVDIPIETLLYHTNPTP